MPTFDESERHNFDVAFRSESVGSKLFDELAPNADRQIAIPVLRGLTDDATVVWTPGISDVGVRTLGRAAGASTSGIWFEVPHQHRSSSGKGLKYRGIKACYQVGTATVADIVFELYKRTIPATGSAPGTPAIIAGQTNSEYDTAHDTAAERVAVAEHVAVVTVPTAAQAYLADGEELLIRAKVVGSASGVVTLKDIVLLATEAG